MSTHVRAHKLTNPSVVTLLSRCNEKYEHYHIQYWMNQIAVDQGLSLVRYFTSGSDEGPDKCEFIWETKVASFVTPTREQIYVCTRKSNSISR